VNEFVRLLQRVTALAQSPDTPHRQEAQLRFEIVKGRLNLFESGEFKAFVDEHPDRRQLVDRLSGVVVEIGGLIDRIDEPPVAAEALGLMAPLESELIGLASEANQYSSDMVTGFENELLGLHRTFSIIALGFFLCGSAFIALLGWNNRLLVRTHVRLSAANANLRRASYDLAAANDAVRQANRDLTVQNQRFDAALNNMARGLCMFDADQRLIVINANFAKIYQLSKDQLRHGITLNQLVGQMVEQEVCSAQVVAETLSRHQDLIKHSRPGTLQQRLKDDRVISISHEPMPDGGWVATYEDVTERQQTEERIAHLARHDPLTGLPNRLMLREHLHEVLAGEASSLNGVAMMCLDLDNFKNINDALGHPVGDVLLCEVAARIVEVVGHGGLIARLGGDEFVIVMQAVKAEDAAALAQNLIEAIARPYELGGHQVFVGTSIGIALASGGDMGSDDLLKKADLALYRAKGEGRGTFRLFEPEMGERVQRNRLIELKLRTANFEEDFEVLFQPLVDLQTKRVTTVEALLRWPGAFQGTVGPDEFIPIAEDSGTIVLLGRWVLEKACNLATQLPPDIHVAVNLSPTQFRRGDIVEIVREVLGETGLAPERLDLEITETLLLDDSKQTLSALQQLRSLGLRVSLDDFGTGYSSLAYLSKFKVDRVKIDRSFVSGIAANRDHLAIVHAIVGLTHALGMTSVAEGVETQEQLMLIRASGCNEAQGHLFSPPIPEQEIKEYLARRGWKLRVA
jgi:diguanylate cyclase (GGDEF)-like protein